MSGGVFLSRKFSVDLKWKKIAVGAEAMIAVLMIGGQTGMQQEIRIKDREHGHLNGSLRYTS